WRPGARRGWKGSTTSIGVTKTSAANCGAWAPTSNGSPPARPGRNRHGAPTPEGPGQGGGDRHGRGGAPEMATEGSPGKGRWAGWAALWFAVGFGLYLFLHSPFFAVHEVEVRGASLLSPQEVIALSGIAPGESLLRIDGERIRRRLEEDP